MDFMSMGLLLLVLAAGFIIIAQRKELQHLREVNGKLQVKAGRDEWVKQTREVMKKDGQVKAVKYIRDETGMSLIDAKQFVDSIGNKK
ncbi:hypothetical protein [Salinicoccus sp. Marseille-QA3877]